MMNLNNTSARMLARPGHFFNLDEVAARVPSIAALEAHESRSERYSQIRTLDVLRGLENEGFQIVEARQGRCRDKAKQDFTKHLIWMQHRDALGADRYVGQEFFRIGLLNSHDGTSAYRLMSGIFRLVCLNGAIVGKQTVEDVRVPHRGQITDRVIEGVYSVVSNAELIAESIGDMKALTLNNDAQELLANAAAQLRWEDPEAMPIQPKQLLTPRRWEDRDSDLWTAFNRVQENVIRGGLRGRRSESGRRMGMRGVTSIDQDIKINRDLWDIASAIVAINKQTA